MILPPIRQIAVAGSRRLKALATAASLFLLTAPLAAFAQAAPAGAPAKTSWPTICWVQVVPDFA